MASRTSYLQPSAEQFYVACSVDVRREIDRILKNLCEDPYINNMTVYALPVPPAILNLFRDPNLWIVFALAGDVLKVYNIGLNPDTPRFR